MKRTVFIFLILMAAISADGFSKGIDIERNVAYTSQSRDQADNLLDIYYPEDKAVPKDVLVFIHGGSWNSGKKETYWWLGKNMARKNVVTVIINYGLSPQYQYEKMAGDCALALKWVSRNIGYYGGRSDRIYVMGHSAGGHLAALINSDPRFLAQEDTPNPIRGVILNDVFGLDMFEYLNSAVSNERNDSFLITFSKDKETWKIGSPINYLQNVNNPMLIFVGERTYPAIKVQSDRLYYELSKANKPAELKLIRRKKHVAMISHMINPANQLYAYILDFMVKH